MRACRPRQFPSAATHRRLDKASCIGCKACIAACPYDAIFINPEDFSRGGEGHSARTHRRRPRAGCVVVCPTQALIVGDATDPHSLVSQVIKREPTCRAREKERARGCLQGGHRHARRSVAARVRRGMFWERAAAGAPIRLSGTRSAEQLGGALLLMTREPARGNGESLYTWRRASRASTSGSLRVWPAASTRRRERCGSGGALGRWRSRLTGAFSSPTSSTGAVLQDLHAAPVGELDGKGASSSPATRRC